MSKAKQRLDFLIDTGLSVKRVRWELCDKYAIDFGGPWLIADTPYEVIDMAMEEWKK